MARGKRRHPTESLGVVRRYTVSNRPMNEINTVHAFGSQGNETSGWPYRNTSLAGVAVGPGLVYRPPRLSQNELGGNSRRRSRRRKRRR